MIFSMLSLKEVTPAARTRIAMMNEVIYSTLPCPKGCCLSAFFLASLVPTMVITEERASLRLLTASRITAVEFAAKPTIALKTTSTMLAAMPIRLTLTISLERFIK